MENNIKDKKMKVHSLSSQNRRIECQQTATNEEIQLVSDKKITLRCGKSSITLYPNGKIKISGEYIMSDSEGVNRLAGGRIELN